VAPPAYAPGDLVATREAYGSAIARLGQADSRVVALDADVKNSTFSEKFEAALPERFYQNFIAEQVMLGSAMGLAARGAIPFPSTFACFLTRAADLIRMAAISNVGVKMAGSHAGVSIGEDGPSQMALEDLAMFRAQPNITVLYPCDAVSAERLVVAAAYQPGPVYIRTSRPKTPVIYDASDVFEVGGLKVLRQGGDDVATVVAAGVTVFEALKAYEAPRYSGGPGGGPWRRPRIACIRSAIAARFCSSRVRCSGVRIFETSACRRASATAMSASAAATSALCFRMAASSRALAATLARSACRAAASRSATGPVAVRWASMSLRTSACCASVRSIPRSIGPPSRCIGPIGPSGPPPWNQRPPGPGPRLPMNGRPGPLVF
jgi:hypothetical protein